MPHAGKIVERLKMVGMLELLSVRKTGLPCLAVPPTMMKSFVAGSGAAQKADVLRAVREVWKAGPENHDEADAFGFAAVAREYFSGGRTDQKMMRKFARYGENAEALRRIRFVFGDRFSPC